MICTGRPSQTRRYPIEVEFAPVGRFFLSFFSWLLPDDSCRRFNSGDHPGFLSCLPLSACVNGWDVCELDDLLVVLLLLLLVYGETSSWRCSSDHVDENIKQAFSCLVASSGRVNIKGGPIANFGQKSFFTVYHYNFVHQKEDLSKNISWKFGGNWTSWKRVM